MTAAPLVCLPSNRWIRQLEERRERRGVEEVDCLFVTCDEEVGLIRSPYEQRVPNALCLGIPGACVDDPDVAEAIRYAVDELGVRRIALASHSQCEYVEEKLLEPTGGSLPALGLTERIHRSNRLMEGARDCIRAGIERLAADPRLEDLGVPIVGLVRAVESDVYYAYYPERDSFEAIL